MTWDDLGYVYDGFELGSWNEHNNRISSHKACSIIYLLDSILFFVSFWTEYYHFLSRERWILQPYARKKLRSHGGHTSSVVSTGSAGTLLTFGAAVVGSSISSDGGSDQA